MSKHVKISLMIMLVFSVLVACSNGNNNPGKNTNKGNTTPATNAATNEGTKTDPEPPTDTKELSGTLDIWGSNSDVDKAFMEKYPNVKITNNAPDDHEDAAIVAMAAGTGAPDVLALSQAHYWKFRAMDGLENLLDAPYNAGDMKADFLEVAWNQAISMDGKSMIGLPITYVPYAMAYRYDIFEQNGLPSEPEEVAALFADPEKFFEAAVQLKNQGLYIFRSFDEVVNLSLPDTNYFDNDLNYIRTGDAYVKSLDYLKRANQLGLVLDGSSDEIKAAMNNGTMITYFNTLGSFDSVYEQDGSRAGQYGKWKLAEIPFGNPKGWGMDIYAIPSQGKNKELAYEYVKFAATAPEAAELFYKFIDIPAYKPSWTLPSIAEMKIPGLDNQNGVEFGINYVQKTVMSPRTPLYEEADDIFSEVLEEMLKNNQDSRAALTQIEERIERSLQTGRARF